MKGKHYLAMGAAALLGACQPSDDSANLPTGTTKQNTDVSDVSAIDLSSVDCRAEQAYSGCVDGRLLHVPSPDWRDQIIYFLMIDRFADGDPSNNDQGVDMYDPSRESHYSGGDIKGATQRIDYMKNLGATAVWTTPHVANMWWDPVTSYGGYHGYWARDFKSVDEHYGTLDDYKDFSHSLHSNGMYLVQDVVVNHVGSFFRYEGAYDPQDVTKNFVLNSAAVPGAAPTQKPFDLVDVNNPEHRAADIYHWTPGIEDFKNYLQETTYQTGSLSDLNTSNPVVKEALKDSFGYWISETGVDAFRIDTVKYVEAEFYEDFLHGKNGMAEVAKATGRDNFFSFGEVFNTSEPYSDTAEKKLAKYVTNASVKRITSPIGFPLYKEISRVFAGGSPTKYLSYRLQAQMREYNDPYLVANFIDNHDVERFLAGGSVEGFKLAYTLMMTIPGIPVIYQGDEQLFLEFRKAMFAGGYQSEQDHFDEQSQMYQFIRTLAEIRKSDKVFSRGEIEILQDNPVAPGVFAYKRSYEGRVAYVVMNTSNKATLLNKLPTPFSEQALPQVLLNHNNREPLVFDTEGALTQVLAPNAAIIFVGTDRSITKPVSTGEINITFTDIQASYENQSSAIVRGKIDHPGAQLLRVIDGDFGRAEKFTADAEGHWQIPLPVSDLGNKEHNLEIYWPDKNVASARKPYRVITTTPEYVAKVDDPKGDANGLTGQYILPLNDSIGCEMDIGALKAQAGGAVMELELTMCKVSAVWNPPNQFDHVAFTIFFDFPRSSGVKELPIIGGSYPSGGNWDFAHMAYGWGNYMYDTAGASASAEGNKLGLAADIEVDYAANKVVFRYDGKAFGVSDWSEVGIYVTTWDKDGGGAYRILTDKEAEWKFGGGKAGDPKILDDAFVRLQ